MTKEIGTTYITTADGMEEIECTFFLEDGELFCDVDCAELDGAEYCNAWLAMERLAAEDKAMEYESDPDDWYFEQARERRAGWLD